MKDYRQYISAKLEEKLIKEINNKNIINEQYVTETKTYTPRQWLARPRTETWTKLVWRAEKIIEESGFLRALAVYIIKYKDGNCDRLVDKVMTSRNKEAIEIILHQETNTYTKAVKDENYPELHTYDCRSYASVGEETWKINVDDLNYLFEKNKLDFQVQEDFDYVWKKIVRMRSDFFPNLNYDLLQGLKSKINKNDLLNIFDDYVFDDVFRLINPKIDLKDEADREWLSKIYNKQAVRLYTVTNNVSNWEYLVKPYENHSLDLTRVNILINFIEPNEEEWEKIFRCCFEGIYKIFKVKK